MEGAEDGPARVTFGGGELDLADRGEQQIEGAGQSALRLQMVEQTDGAGATSALEAQEKVVAQLEEQLEAERAAQASNAVLEGLQNQVPEVAAV